MKTPHILFRVYNPKTNKFVQDAPTPFGHCNWSVHLGVSADPTRPARPGMGGEASAEPLPPIFMLQPRQYPPAGTEIQSISQITDLLPIPFTGLYAASDEPIFHGDVVQTFSKSRTRTRSHKSYVANYKTSHCEWLHTQSGQRQSYVTTKTSVYYRIIGSAITNPDLIQNPETRKIFDLSYKDPAYRTDFVTPKPARDPENSLPGKDPYRSNGADTCRHCGEPIEHLWNEDLQKGIWIHNPNTILLHNVIHKAEPSPTEKFYEFQNPDSEKAKEERRLDAIHKLQSSKTLIPYSVNGQNFIFHKDKYDQEQAFIKSKTGEKP